MYTVNVKIHSMIFYDILFVLALSSVNPIKIIVVDQNCLLLAQSRTSNSIPKGQRQRSA